MFVAVALAAVCVIRPTQGPPEMRVLELNGHLPTRGLSPAAEPRAIAQDMLEEILGSIPPTLRRMDPTLRKVGFFSAQETGETGIRLVYTVGIPWCLEASPSADWVKLPVTRAGSKSACIRFGVRDEWRQLAEETTAGMDLLPRYFTIPEMQDVYQAIWNVQQLSNFHRWVQLNPGMLTSVSAAERERADEELHRVATGRVAAASGWAPLWASTGSTVSAVAGGAAMGVIGAALAPAALVGLGTTLGYRNLRRSRPPLAKERGREPEYYTRGPLERLEVIYAPRPSWDLPLGETLVSLLGGRRNVVDDEGVSTSPHGLRVTVRDPLKVDLDGLAALGVSLTHRADQTHLRFEQRASEFATEVKRVLAGR